MEDNVKTIHVDFQSINKQSLLSKYGSARFVFIICHSINLISNRIYKCSLAQMSVFLCHESTFETQSITDIKTEHMKSALEICLVNLEEHYIEFENKLANNSSTVDYKTIFHTLETIKSPLKFSWGLISHLLSVQNNDAIRKVHIETTKSY